jgi:type IV pilus assembly protein PilM
LAFSLSNLLNKSSDPVLGLDVSNTTIKLVELSPVARDGWRLERFSVENLPVGAVVDGNIENVDAVAEVVKKALQRGGFRLKRVAMAVPAAAVITKKISLPATLLEDEMDALIESEAAQYIPFSLEEVMLDYQIIGVNQNVATDNEILIAASRKEKVEDRVVLAEMCGLKPVVIDIDLFAARHALSQTLKSKIGSTKNQVVALLQLGASSSNLSIILNQQVIYEREQAFGGLHLTHDIARMFGLPLEDAEIKKRTNDLPENYASDILNPFITYLADEILRAIQFFFTSTPFSKVDYVELAGGTALLLGLKEAVQERIGAKTSIVNPFIGMAMGGSVREKQLQLDAPALLIASGLSMRRA